MFIYRSGACEDHSVGKLHFIWKDQAQSIYIMDEHQGALVSWLLETKESDEYTLFHIDYHWDATDIVEDQLKELDEWKNLTDEKLLLERMLSLRIPSGHLLIDWTNYIAALLHLRPNMRKAFFASYQDQDQYPSKLLRDSRVQMFTPDQLIAELPNLMSVGADRLLVNIDFDFLCRNYQKALPDELFVQLTSAIKERLDGQTILTAAWTPTLCGGCDTAADICKLFCDTLKIECPAVHLR